MTREIIQKTQDATILHVQKSKVQSVQKKTIQKTGCRIYQSGFIGVAGAVGSVDEVDLEKRALDMIAMEIPYLPEPTKHQQHTKQFQPTLFLQDDFVPSMESLLDSMRTTFPDFAFSHNIQWLHRTHSMKNDVGLSLLYDDQYLSMQFLFRHDRSLELMDGHLSCVGRAFDKEVFLQSCQEKLEAFLNPVDLPPERTFPVIFSTDYLTLLIPFMQDLNGRNLATKSSKLHDQVGTLQFHRDFTLYQSHYSENLCIPFFDSEGVSHPETEYRVPLIQEGVILQGFSDKRTAREFQIPHTGSASSEFDGIPSLSHPPFELRPGTKTLAELLDGRTGVYVDIASGGDYTPQGEFATPVQVAYLVKNGRFIGKLPPLQLNSTMQAMFGHDFIGISQDPLIPLNSEHAIVMNFVVNKI